MKVSIEKRLYETIRRAMVKLDSARGQLALESQRDPLPYPWNLDEIAEMIGKAHGEMIDAANLVRRRNGKMERPE